MLTTRKPATICLLAALTGCSEEPLSGSEVIPILYAEQSERDPTILEADFETSETILEDTTHLVADNEVARAWVLETESRDVCFIVQTIESGEPSPDLAGVCGEPAAVALEGMRLSLGNEDHSILALLLPTGVKDSNVDEVAAIDGAIIDKAGENFVITVPASAASQLEEMELEGSQGAFSPTFVN